MIIFKYNLRKMESLKSNIIETILQIEDKTALSKLNDFVKTLPKANNSTNGNQTIQPVELETGVSLADIREIQKVEPISFEAIQAMFKDEVWEASLEDLLNSLD